MFTQLSLFDLPSNVDRPVQFDSAGPFDAAVPVVAFDNPEVCREPVLEKQSTAKTIEPIRIYGEERRGDSIQPMGDLARAVLARYEMVARRRQEMLRRKAEQPRRSIRVLSPS